MPQPHQRRRPQNQRQQRPNKAQQREAQVRAEQMSAKPSAELLATSDDGFDGDAVVDDVGDDGLAPVIDAPTVTLTPREPTQRKDTRRQPNRRAIAAPVGPAISREQEYEFARADLRRLLITAGAVLVLMLALLFVIEG